MTEMSECVAHPLPSSPIKGEVQIECVAQYSLAHCPFTSPLMGEDGRG
jgi:hypothetical protein